jgi:myo-inositol-1(or 4)-monophosphatase
MNAIDPQKALAAVTVAAQAAGQLMRVHLHKPKKINQAVQHDIKLELDVRCQKLIQQKLSGAFPEVAVLGEEGVGGDQDAPWRWVIDPIDGTVNFAYGIPHACVSVALQRRAEVPAAANSHAAVPRVRTGTLIRSRKNRRRKDTGQDISAYETVAGVVYDPFAEETWSAIAGQPALLNGKIIRPSRRGKMAEAIVSVGFAKSKETLEQMLPTFHELLHRVRKIRIMGSAALAMTYVACGRFDAYIEAGVRLWDIAAGGLILESAGGEFWRQRLEGWHRYAIIANNGLLRSKLQKFCTAHAGNS